MNRDEIRIERNGEMLTIEEWRMTAKQESMAGCFLFLGIFILGLFLCFWAFGEGL